MFNPTISAILRGAWLIDEQFAQSHLPLVLGVLQGKISGSEFMTGNGEMEKPFAIDAQGKRIEMYVWSKEQYKYVLNEAGITPGSIAVIPLIGPVMKYNGSCGEPGMIQRQGWISDLLALDNVVGMISYIDSPGGQADGTPQFADYIKSITKPKIAFINGGAYSAGAWAASAHDAIYASSDFSGFGSIGAYTTIVDYRGYFEKQGYKLKSVYPKESKDKNLSYRKAIDGDLDMITEEISELAKYFISAFAANREGKLTSDEWNTGKIFSATESIRIGLIDGIKSFDEVVAEIRGNNKPSTNGRGSSANNKSTNSNLTHTEMKFDNLAALAGNTAPTEEQIDLANADLTANGITGATVVAESFITESAAVTAENTRLTEELATANTSLSTAQADLATANGNLTASQTRVTELENTLRNINGSTHNQENGSAADVPPGGDNTAQALMDSLPHNKRADEMLG